MKVIHIDQLKACFPGSKCISFHAGIVIFWDSDLDTRIVTVIDDNLEVFKAHGLVAIQETEGTLQMVWALSVPPQFESGQCYSSEAIWDTWVVDRSYLIGGPHLPAHTTKDGT